MMTDAGLIRLAASALTHAYAPYSSKKVGAAILTMDNQIYTGCNVENATFGLSTCAERTAVYRAVCDGIRDFQAIAVVSNEYIFTFPCMSCQAVLAEFAPHIKIILQQDDKIKTFSLSRLFQLTLMNNQRRIAKDNRERGSDA
jgi:cytidine deaminase